MIKKKRLLFCLFVFVQLFSMEQKGIVCLSKECIDAYKKIQFDYLDITSIESLSCTCKPLSDVFNTLLIPAIFIRDEKTGEYLRIEKYGNRVFSCVMRGVYQDRFDLCTQTLSFLAQQCIANQKETDLEKTEYHKQLEQFASLYSLHADERNQGLMTVHNLKVIPRTEDCIEYYEGYCDKQDKPFSEAKAGCFLKQLDDFFETKNWIAVKAQLLNKQLFDLKVRSDYVKFDVIFKKTLNTCDGDIILQVIRLMKARFHEFVLFLLKEKKTTLLDYVCNNFGSKHTVLCLLLNVSFTYPDLGPEIQDNLLQYINEFIKKKNINVHLPNVSGQSFMDYVLKFTCCNRKKQSLLMKTLISNYKVDVIRPGYDGKTLLERFGLRYNDPKKNRLPLFDIQQEDVNAAVDSQGNRLLHYYVYGYDYDAVKWLLETMKADVNSKNNEGNTPLALMLTNTDIRKDLNREEFIEGEYVKPEYKIIKLMFDYSADVHAVNKEGYSLWHLVCIGYKQFLKNSIDTWSANWNPSDEGYVCSRKKEMIDYYLKLMKILIKKGADKNAPLPNSTQVAHDNIDDFYKQEWNNLIKTYNIQENNLQKYKAPVLKNYIESYTYKSSNNVGRYIVLLIGAGIAIYSLYRLEFIKAPAILKKL